MLPEHLHSRLSQPHIEQILSLTYGRAPAHLSQVFLSDSKISSPQKMHFDGKTSAFNALKNECFCFFIIFVFLCQKMLQRRISERSCVVADHLGNLFFTADHDHKLFGSRYGGI